MSGVFLLAYVIHQFVRGEQIAGDFAIEAGGTGHLDQDFGGREVARLEKIAVEQRIDHGALISRGTRPGDEAVGIQRVRLHLHATEIERNVDLAAGSLDARIDFASALRTAELVREILRAIHPRGRHLRVQLEGMPAHLRLVLRMTLAPQGERLLQTPFADEAPGADHVGNDVDVQGQLLWQDGPRRVARADTASGCRGRAGTGGAQGGSTHPPPSGGAACARVSASRRRG